MERFSISTLSLDRLITSKVRFFLVLSMFLLILTNSPTLYAKSLVLAAADQSIPTSYIEDGQQVGILIDVINEAFNRAGYSVEIKLMPWARCLIEVENGNVDGIFSAFITEERLSFLTYAEEVLITQVQAFFVRSDSDITFDGNLSSLEDYSIGLIKGTSHGPRLDTAIEEGTFKKIDVTQNSQSNVSKLVAGRIDLLPSYRHIVLSTAKELDYVGKIKQLSPEIEAIHSYLAFSKKRDFSNEIDDFNRALSSMKLDGTYDQIFNKYLK
jgi:polar amino acid transport system substrate-binding protein